MAALFYFLHLIYPCFSFKIQQFEEFQLITMIMPSGKYAFD